MERMRVTKWRTRCAACGDLTPAQRDTVEQLSRSLMQKFLHEPSVRLRAAAGNGRGLGIVDAARYLFGVENAAEGETQGEGEGERDCGGTASPPPRRAPSEPEEPR